LRALLKKFEEGKSETALPRHSGVAEEMGARFGLDDTKKRNLDTIIEECNNKGISNKD